jgi:hypothetical protein
LRGLLLWLRDHFLLRLPSWLLPRRSDFLHRAGLCLPDQLAEATSDRSIQADVVLSMANAAILWRPVANPVHSGVSGDCLRR